MNRKEERNTGLRPRDAHILGAMVVPVYRIIKEITFGTVSGTQYKITRRLEMARQHVQKAGDTEYRNKCTADPEMRVTELKKEKKNN